MRRLLILFIMMLAMKTVTYAQTGNNQVSIGPEVDLPIGTFGDYYKLGFGGSVKGLFGVGTAGQVTLMAGYSSFTGKSDAPGYDLSSYKFNIIPILVGYRQNFSGFYAEPQLGMAIYNTKVSGISESETRFTWAIGAGYAMSAFDIGVRYQSHTGSNLFALRIAYALNFGSMVK